MVEEGSVQSLDTSKSLDTVDAWWILEDMLWRGVSLGVLFSVQAQSIIDDVERRDQVIPRHGLESDCRVVCAPNIPWVASAPVPTPAQCLSLPVCCRNG
jgi:hypothetical protein